MKKLEKFFLDPKQLLIEAFVEWLQGRARKKNGADSLDHLLIVVPGAQCARMLRRRIAMSFENGVLAPRIVMPRILLDSPDCATASPVQLRSAFIGFMESADTEKYGIDRALYTTARDWCALLDHLNEVWDVLGRGGKTFSNVLACNPAVELLRSHAGELDRWKKLAALEEDFFRYLSEQGLRHPDQVIKDVSSGTLPPPEIVSEAKEIVLPSLVDAMDVFYRTLPRWDVDVTVLVHADEKDSGKFDEWGRPVPERWTGDCTPHMEDLLRDEDVVTGDSDTALAANVAASFPDPDVDCERPFVGLVDESLIPQLIVGFAGRRYRLHVAKNCRFSVSSLGRLVNVLLGIYAADDISWGMFSELLRLDDVCTAVCHECNKDRSDKRICRSTVLHQLDEYRETFIPGKLPERLVESDPDRHWQFDQLTAAFDCLRPLVAERRGGAVKFIRSFLLWTYSRVPDIPAEHADEFRFAATGLHNLLDSVEALGDDRHKIELLRQGLAELSYAPRAFDGVDPHEIGTCGWVDLQWASSRQVALCGMHEEAVPKSVVGHPVLPESLRVALGLDDNRRQLANCTFRLCEMLRSRNPGDVRAFTAMVNSSGDIHRPSRLLFLCDSNHIAGRVARLFSGSREPSVSPLWNPSKDFLIRPVDVDSLKFDNVSVTSLDVYLRNPLQYLIGSEMGLANSVSDELELGYGKFGSLLHAVLEKYALEQIESSRNGGKQLSDPGEIDAAIMRIFDSESALYAGSRGGVALQLESLRGRLKSFVRIQAGMSAEGWEILHAEMKLHGLDGYEDVARNFGAGIPVHGIVDRIDRRVAADGSAEYRILDYKAYDLGKSEIKLCGAIQVPLYKYFISKILHWPLDRVQCAHVLIGSTDDESGVVDWNCNRYSGLFHGVLDGCIDVLRGIRSSNEWFDWKREYDELRRLKEERSNHAAEVAADPDDILAADIDRQFKKTEKAYDKLVKVMLGPLDSVWEDKLMSFDSPPQETASRQVAAMKETLRLLAVMPDGPEWTIDATHVGYDRRRSDGTPIDLSEFGIDGEIDAVMDRVDVRTRDDGTKEYLVIDYGLGHIHAGGLSTLDADARDIVVGEITMEDIDDEDIDEEDVDEEDVDEEDLDEEDLDEEDLDDEDDIEYSYVGAENFDDVEADLEEFVDGDAEEIDDSDTVVDVVGQCVKVAVKGRDPKFIAIPFEDYRRLVATVLGCAESDVRFYHVGGPVFKGRDEISTDLFMNWEFMTGIVGWIYDRRKMDVDWRAFGEAVDCAKAGIWRMAVCKVFIESDVGVKKLQYGAEALFSSDVIAAILREFDETWFEDQRRRLEKCMRTENEWLWSEGVER